MAEGVAGLALGDGAEQRRHVGVALDVGLLGEVQVAAVGLALAGERFLEVLVGLGALELRYLHDGHAIDIDCQQGPDRGRFRVSRKGLTGDQLLCSGPCGAALLGCEAVSVTGLVPFDRAAMLRRLADEPFDVLVVGGGITGVGVALDAASRGLRTALVERGDFASGTSSKSSKLVHGGLRYLQQGEVRPRLRGPRRAPAAAPQRPPPRAGAAVPDPDPHPGRRRAPPRSPGPSARPCGGTTSPAGCASASSTSASRRPRRWPTCRRMPAERLASRLPLLRRPRRRRPARASPSPARRPPTGPRSPTTPPSPACAKGADGTGHRRRRSRPTAPRSTCGRRSW